MTDHEIIQQMERAMLSGNYTQLVYLATQLSPGAARQLGSSYTSAGSYGSTGYNSIEPQVDAQLGAMGIFGGRR